MVNAEPNTDSANTTDTMYDVVIRAPRGKEAEILEGMYLEMLTDLQIYNIEMLATEDNARWMTENLFMPAAERGEGVLIAWVNDMPGAAIFWASAPLPLDYRRRTANGYGTYVRPEFRRAGLATKLRKAAAARLRALGFEAVVGQVERSNEPGREATRRAGFQTFALLERLML